MSLSNALYSGVSGLFAQSAALAAISDNIANSQTVGYKRHETDFQTLVTAGTYSRGHYNAGGVLAQSTERVGAQGQLQRTTNGTDLGLDGAGFLVGAPSADGAAGARVFTRAGAFTPDDEGNLRNTAGYFLQGWPADADGTIASDPSDLTRLRTVNVLNAGGAAAATTRATVTGNLNAGQALSAEAATYDPATNSMAAYDATTGAGTKPDFEVQVPVYDTQGNRRTLTMSLLRAPDPANPGQALPNRWLAELRAVPASDVETGGGLSNGQLRTGTLAFTADGKLDAANSTLLTGGALAIGASDGAAPAAGGAKWADGLGVGAQSVTLDLAGGLTQLAGPSAIAAVTSDGSAPGALAGVEIDAQGFVTAVFDNGLSKRIAQVAIATFPNPDGLKALSGNAYQVSTDSGTFSLKAPGDGGAGRLSASTLEMSTVDLAAEFTGLITTQRAYSASSKIITTADEMLDEVIRIKR